MIRRSITGLVVAGLVAGGALYWLDWKGRDVLAQGSEVRSSRLQVMMLADLVGRVLDEDGEAARQVVDRFAATDLPFKTVRVVVGRDLVASSATADQGEAAAPRRLAREEKELYDQAQALRAAVENNADPTAPRQDEVVVAGIEGGGVRVGLPLASDGVVVGMVSAERPPFDAHVRPPLARSLLVVVVPALLMLVVGRFVGERRVLLAIVAGLLLVGGFVLTANLVWSGIEEAQREGGGGLRGAAARLGRALTGAETFARRSLEAVGVAESPTLDAASWDSDLQRRPIGLLRADGSIVEDTLDDDIAGIWRAFRRGVVLVGVLAVAISLLFSLGGAARLREIVVTHREAYSYTTPALLGMVILVFFPFVYGVVLSFTNMNIYNESKPPWEIWVGVDNYVDILTDFDVASRAEDGSLAWDYTNFYLTLVFTLIWTVSNVTIGVSVGLLLALILNTKGLAFKPIYRVLLILPWAVPNYITALIWKGMFHQQFGVVNQVVQMFGGEAVSWFESPLSSFVTILATNGWLSFPFMMVIALGALQSIPGDLYEAARVDGATRWQQFTSITLPSLKPALVPAVILSVVWTFNMFNIPYLVSQGEPAGATEILITDAYKIAFEQYRKGYAAAYSVVIFGILLVYGIWQNRVTQATEGV